LKDEIKNLKALQKVDLEIREINEEMAVGTAGLDKQQSSIDALKDELAEFTEKLEGGEVRRRELEAEVEDAQLMVKDRQNKLMNVQTNREYQSILKEIEDAKNANKQRDDELVRLLEQAEYYDTKKEESSAACAQLEAKLAEETATHEATATKLTTRKAKVEKTRNTKAKKVKKPLLGKYERLLEKRDGLAMVGANNGVCHGCYMNVPPQLYNELLREDQLHSCPTCNRLLYYIEVSDD
jgi:predicted  nucleic acid-binding Zn-ribbon protein